MKEAIFELIDEGLSNHDPKTQKLAQRFAQSIQRTREILNEEKKGKGRDHGEEYLKQLAFMTDYLLHHRDKPLTQRFATIAPKLREMELHQYHQLWKMHHPGKASKTSQKKTKTVQKKTIKTKVKKRKK